MVALELLEAGFLVQLADLHDLAEDEGFAAESFLGGGAGIGADTVNGCTDEDDAGDPDHDAEQGEEAAEFVGEDRIEGERGSATEVVAESGAGGWEVFCHVSG